MGLCHVLHKRSRMRETGRIMTRTRRFTLALLVILGLIAASGLVESVHAWPWSSTSTVKVSISNNNWAVNTYCTNPAKLRDTRTGKIMYTAAPKGDVWGRGCSVTFNNVVNRKYYRLDIPGYVSRANDKYFAVVKDVYIHRPNTGNTVTLDKIYFYK